MYIYIYIYMMYIYKYLYAQARTCVREEFVQLAAALSAKNDEPGVLCVRAGVLACVRVCMCACVRVQIHMCNMTDSYPLVRMCDKTHAYV